MIGLTHSRTHALTQASERNPWRKHDRESTDYFQFEFCTLTLRGRSANGELRCSRYRLRALLRAAPSILSAFQSDRDSDLSFGKNPCAIIESTWYIFWFLLRSLFLCSFFERRLTRVDRVAPDRRRVWTNSTRCNRSPTTTGSLEKAHRVCVFSVESEN